MVFGIDLELEIGKAHLKLENKNQLTSKYKIAVFQLTVFIMQNKLPPGIDTFSNPF